MKLFPGQKLYLPDTTGKYKYRWLTLGCFLKDQGGQLFFTTADHGFKNILRNDLYAKDNTGNKISIGYRIKSFKDIAICQLRKDISTDPFFYGIATPLKGMIVLKTGSRTGTGKGYISKIDNELCTTFPLFNEEWTLKGDSGCPYFTEDKKLLGFGMYGNNEIWFSDDEWGKFFISNIFFNTQNYKLLTRRDHMSDEKKKEVTVIILKGDAEEVKKILIETLQCGGGGF